MANGTGDYDALRPRERSRLERFAAAFEQVDALDYERYGGATTSEAELEAARTTASGLLGSGARREAAERAMRSFTDAADVALRRRMPMPQMLFGLGGASIRTEDRVRALQSLERAVVAIILWDELRDDERDALLGPWARVADRAMAGLG